MQLYSSIVLATTPHTWTPSQQSALDSFDAFLASADLRSVFVLRGAAGTGKTTLVQELVRRAKQRGNHARLMAPTGRAARVLGQRTNAEATTIHAGIFTLDRVDEILDQSEQPVFHHQLKSSSEPCNTVFFIDEASMLSDKPTMDTNLRFGCDRLLKDLVDYVFWAHPDPSRKLVLIGDHCQLPPIDMPSSPALDIEYLASEHALKVCESQLTDVVRQEQHSVLVKATTALRDLIEQPKDQRHTLEWTAGPGLVIHERSDSFQAALHAQWLAQRTPHIICYKNTTVRDWNQWTREVVLNAPVDARASDRLIVLRNHAESALRNGDFVTLVEIGARHTRQFRDVSLYYAKVRVRFESADGEREWSGMMLENALLSPARDLSDEEAQARWVLFKMDHPHLRPGSPEMKNALRSDPYWNCLIARYGYATTCHKGQGGEWDEVFVECDLGASHGSRNDESLRWLYTAATRAKRTLHLLKPPKWSASGTLDGSRNALAQPTVQTSSGEAKESLSPVELIRFILCEAAQAAGIEVEPTMRVMQYQIRATWIRPQGALTASVYHGGDGTISKIIWEGVREGDRTFDQSELESRRHAKLPPTDFSQLHAGVQQTWARVRASAKAQGLDLHCTLKPFQLVLTAFDAQSPELGIARVQAHYNGSGIVTKHTILDQASPLTARLKSMLDAVR